MRIRERVIERESMESIDVNSEKKYCQKQAIIFNSFNQIITNTLAGDIMVLFLTDILLFKTVNITFIISLIPLIGLVSHAIIYSMELAGSLEIYCFHNHLSDLCGIWCWHMLAALNEGDHINQ